MTESRLVDMTLREFVETCASSAPAPGGGSVAAAAGALAAALTTMVGNLTVGKKKYADVEDKMTAMLGKATALQTRFMQLVDDDTKAFNRVMAAFGMPKESDDEKAARSKAIEDATYAASQTPMSMMRACAELMTQIDIAALDGNRNSVSDAGVASAMARAAAQGAYLNIIINASSLKDTEKARALQTEAENLLHSVTAHSNTVFDAVIQAITG